MNERLKFKTWNLSSRRKHRQYTLWYQKLSSIFWMSPQARGKKSKNKQMGPSSVVQLCLTLCDPMDCSTPGFAVHHQLPELAQTHVHWVGDAIQSSHPVIPFSSCLQSFPASGSFPMSQFFASGGQSIGASASVLPMNIQDWFPLGLTGWISLQSKGLKSLLQHHSSKTSILWHSAFFIVQLSHPDMTTGKTIALTRWTFVSKVNISAF